MVVGAGLLVLELLFHRSGHQTPPPISQSSWRWCS